MDQFIEKISSYNLLNYLFCGIIFVMLSNTYTSYSFLQSDVFIGIFFYYFIGLIVSRIGSLILDPFLKLVRFIKFADYHDYLKVSEHDQKLLILSESNNVYRTLICVVICVLFLKFYTIIIPMFPIIKTIEPYSVTVFLLVLFLFSYKKQSSYIVERIKDNLNYKTHE